MNAASIVSVITVFGLVGLSLLALYVEKGERPFRRTRLGFRRLPAWEKTVLVFFVGAWIAFASVKEGTNGVSQVEGDTNTVTQIEGNTNGMGPAPGPLMMGFFGRPNLTSGMTPSITDEDIARMWRISSTTDVGGLAAPTVNAVTNAAWCDYGGMSASFRIKPMGWNFPYGDKATMGLTVFQNGDFRPNVKTHFFPRPFDVNLSLLPRMNWGLLPDGGESVFWHEHTSSNSLVLTWHNALYNREASCPTNFQAELFADGRFDYRYPDRTVRYAPVFPFDWDGDGLENSVDPDPQTANPIDAHGANDEWLQIVCSNVFMSVGNAVTFRAEVNTNAYYFVEVCAEREPAPIYFVSDHDSRLGSPVIVANGGETNRVPLLIGAEYAVTSTVPITVEFKDEGFAEVTQNDARSYAVKWPLAFHFAEGTHGQYTVSAVPYDPGVAYDWASTPDYDEPGGRIPLMSSPLPSECRCWSGNGATVQFICSDNCGCGGDCRAVGTASIENASFSVTGGVCHCSLPNDHPSESPPSMPDPLVGGFSIEFSKKAVIFEDEYRNTEDGPLVPRRSTTTLLTVSASGGFYGGSFSLTTRNLGKLIAANGPGPVSLIAGKILAPYETYFASFVCEGVIASGSANDVEVSGSFIEFDTGRTEDSSDAVTVVEVYFEPVIDLACENRHAIGVREEGLVKWRPSSLQPTVSSSGEGQVFLHPGYARYCAPLECEPSGIFFKWGDASRDISLSVLEPQAVFVAGFPTQNDFGLGHNSAGGVGMALELHIMPTNVAFLGIAVQEVPTTYNDAQGYFANSYFSNVWSHTRERHAGEWHNVASGNFFMIDNADMGDVLPRMTLEGVITNDCCYGWIRGKMNWRIPVGWNERNSSDDKFVIKTFQTYWQQFVINAQGTLRITKLGNWIQRGTNNVIYINGVAQ